MGIFHLLSPKVVEVCSAYRQKGPSCKSVFPLQNQPCRKHVFEFLIFQNNGSVLHFESWIVTFPTKKKLLQVYSGFHSDYCDSMSMSEVVMNSIPISRETLFWYSSAELSTYVQSCIHNALFSQKRHPAVSCWKNCACAVDFMAS